MDFITSPLRSNFILSPNSSLLPDIFSPSVNFSNEKVIRKFFLIEPSSKLERYNPSSDYIYIYTMCIYVYFQEFSQSRNPSFWNHASLFHFKWSEDHRFSFLGEKNLSPSLSW